MSRSVIFLLPRDKMISLRVNLYWSGGIFHLVSSNGRLVFESRRFFFLVHRIRRGEKIYGSWRYSSLKIISRVLTPACRECYHGAVINETLHKSCDCSSLWDDFWFSFIDFVSPYRFVFQIFSQPSKFVLAKNVSFLNYENGIKLKINKWRRCSEYWTNG